jgi:hypothetical protein
MSQAAMRIPIKPTKRQTTTRPASTREITIQSRRLGFWENLPKRRSPCNGEGVAAGRAAALSGIVTGAPHSSQSNDSPAHAGSTS